MITVYFLPVGVVDGTEQVAGAEFIHDALLLCTEEPDIRKLIQDTTDIEHSGLVAASGVSWEATQEEIDRYNARVVITPPNPDMARAKELLSNSPDVITQPEMWELMRIFGRLHGITPV